MNNFSVSSQLNLKNESLIEREKARKGETFAPRRRKYDPFQSSIPSYLICCEPTEKNTQVSPQHFVTLAKKLVVFTVSFFPHIFVFWYF